MKKTDPSGKAVDGQCAGPAICPLSQVKAGTLVNIKQLVLAPDVSDRLREMGLGEEQQIRLLRGDSNFICQVCNARVALSEKLAGAIMVEPVA